MSRLHPASIREIMVERGEFEAKDSAETFNAKPFFILGCPRSGATLLSLVLDSHPNLSVGRETNVMRAMSLLAGDWSEGSIPVPMLHPFYTIDAENSWYEKYGMTRADFMKWIRQFLNQFFAQYAVGNGKKRWGEKSPKHCYFAKLICEVFPEAQLIHIVRDPRSVCYSQRGANRPLVDLAREWTRVNHYLDEMGELLGSSQYLSVRYEDLILKTRETLENIMNFLDEPWDERMLQHEKIVSDEKALDKWKKGLRKVEIRLIQHIAKDVMKKFDYPLAKGLIPLIGKIKLES